MLLLIPLLPFLGFVINAFLGRRLPKAVSGGIACLAMIGAFIVSVVSAWTMAQSGHAIEQTAFMWVESGVGSPGSGQMALSVPFRLMVDPLAAVMILVVTGIGSLIHIYSTGYMHEESDSEYARYFAYLNLFAAFMLVLVLGSSFPVMFIGWEGVGLCSYLLIGYWFTKKSASDAGKKAFIVNRIGDFGFILAMLLIFVTFGTLEFQEVAQRAAERPVETAGIGVLTAATLLLFLGATGKSAQIPLYVWLPDAMEGPTPVSALIHAATMVTAGVYMIGRNAVMFEQAPLTMAVVAAVGVATALMAGTIGLVQNDIKRVLAYSTVSQLGFMFLAMGVGAFAAGIFHLYTHAFFKALLFLGSGAVIHALAGEQDIRNMGGLRKHLPITYWTFLIGAVAIAGIPPLAGFFSKDEILYRTFITDLRWPQLNELLYVIGVLTSLLTAIYMFRLVFLTFHGERRHLAPPEHPEEEEPAAHGHGHGVPGPGGAHGATPTHAHAVHAGQTVQAAHGGHGAHGIHDAPWAMAIPLILLAIGSVVAGYVGVPHALGGSNRIESFLHPSFQPPGAAHEAAPTETQAAPATSPDAHAPAQETAHGVAAGDHAAAGNEQTELMLMALSTGVAVAGIGIAMFFWLRRPDAADAMQRRFAPVHRVLLGKYYVDELYDATVVHPIQRLSTGGLWKGVDATVIDGMVNGVGLAVRGSSNGLRRVQTGSIRAYAASLFLGVVLILGWYLWRP